MSFVKNICLTLLVLCSFVLVGVERKIVNNTSSTLAIQINYLNTNSIIPCSFKSIIIEPFKDVLIPNHPINDCLLFSVTINIEKGFLSGQRLQIPLEGIDKNTNLLLSIEDNRNILIGQMTQNGSTKTFKPS